MLEWKELDPRRFERGVQGLLRSLHRGMVSIDGSGGDGGADGMLRTADGRTVFEMKSFSPRLTAKNRRKVASSLSTARKTVGDMLEWVLILPMNPTRSELDWFENELRRVAPGVTLTWYGIDWLDQQAAANPAFARYVQGRDNQLLQAAAELHIEESVLTRGAADVVSRNRRLRERVDEISMHWTLDWSIKGATTTATIRPVHDDAPIVDPIRLTPQFAFASDDPQAHEVRTRLEAAQNFGGTVEIGERYFRGFRIEASDEVKLLMAGMEDPGTLQMGLLHDRVTGWVTQPEWLAWS